MDPAGGEEVPEPHVAVLGDEAVRPAGQRGGVKLEQRGQVVAVGDGDQVVDWLGGVGTCMLTESITANIDLNWKSSWLMIYL